MSEPKLSQSGLKMNVSAKDLVIIGLLALSILMSSVTLGVVMVGRSASNNLRVDEPIDAFYNGGTSRHEGGFEIKNGLLILKGSERTRIRKFPNGSDASFSFAPAKIAEDL